jgi:hypothetical protein
MHTQSLCITMAGIFHMAGWTLTWFIKQDEMEMRKTSGKVEAVPTSNLARLNNIWYTQQVGSMNRMKPAGFARYLDNIVPGQVGLILYYFDRMPWSHVTDPLWHGLKALCHMSQACHDLWTPIWSQACHGLSTKN